MNRTGDRFTCFPDLPYELRCQVWGNVIPDYGIHLIECYPARVDSKTIRLALRRAHHEYEVCGQKQRFRTQKILLATCVESRAEFCRHFPDTLRRGGPRFSFRHDLIYITSDFFLCHTLMWPELNVEYHLEFEGGWNTLVHRLAMNREFCQIWACEFRFPSWTSLQDWRLHCRPLKIFMDFLTSCIRLKQLVLIRPDGIGFDAWLELPRGDRRTLTESMADSYGGLICQASARPHMLADVPDRTLSFLRHIIHDDPEFDIDPSWVGKVRTGYPMLKDLEISKMVHVSWELRWLCKEL